jgi:replicative DNA helicase
MNEPRQDIEAEKAVIGSILHDPKLLNDITLHGGDFYRAQHEEVWDIMLAEHRAGRPVDLLSLSTRLSTSPIMGLEPTFLHDCYAIAVPSAAEHHAQIVAGLASLRRMVSAGLYLQQMAQEMPWDKAEQALDDGRAKLDVIANETAGIKVRTFREALESAIHVWEQGEGRAYPTGWTDLDRRFNGGWHPGQLTVMGARPAVGKSMVAGCAALAASEYGVGFFSLEMKEHEVVGRMTAAAMKMNMNRLNSMKLNEDDWQKVATFVGQSWDWPVYIEEKSRITMAQVRAIVRSWKRRGPVPLVIVDYLQLVQPADYRETRERQVSRIAEDCKHLAKEFDTHVLALAQVNRQSTQRQDTRPTMADLRESGGIEAHADNIILLHRDEEEMEGQIELIIEKNRHGETGKIRLAWRPQIGSVNTLSHPRQYMNPLTDYSHS